MATDTAGLRWPPEILRIEKIIAINVAPIAIGLLVAKITYTNTRTPKYSAMKDII
jgi:hypothetical protein